VAGVGFQRGVANGPHAAPALGPRFEVPKGRGALHSGLDLCSRLLQNDSESPLFVEAP
jgi:hypothetical protein